MLLSLNKSTSIVREFTSTEVCLRVDRGFGGHQPSGSYSDLLLRRQHKNHLKSFQKNRCQTQPEAEWNLSEAGPWKSAF